MFQNDGYCDCCDSRTQFVPTSDWWRETIDAQTAIPIPRERELMFCNFATGSAKR